MRPIRFWAHAVLSLLVSLFAVAPHHHEGIAENLSGERIAKIGRCDTPNTRHFHRARAEEGPPCVACVRQHSAGALKALLSSTAPIAPLGILSGPPSAPSIGTLRLTSVRGPPAA
ncbi:MAG TPA: hypothetical protein VFL80_04560 [Thermoanaerobaculia bacterium]|nr:hypothetical protein [Thermoanaerobaculia bacterium]